MLMYASLNWRGQLNLECDVVVSVEFVDDSWYNFEKSQKIVDDIYLVEAIGHTMGKSIVIVKDD